MTARTATPRLDAETRARRELTRRRFLQGALAAGGTTALDPAFFRNVAFAGPPLGPTDRILVVIEQDGGNDGLNTLVPVGDATYYTRRGTAANATTAGAGNGIGIPTGLAIGLGEGFALHPELTYLKSRWDDGDLAVVRGAGHPSKDHSHFTCMARVMAGNDSTVFDTGIFGRWLDAVGADGLAGVNIGDTNVPLLLRGVQAEVTGLPGRGGLLGASTQTYERLAFDQLVNLGDDTIGKGPWGEEVARVFQAAVREARRINPIYSPNVSGNSFVKSMTYAARLINLDIGTRVITIRQGGYDTHSDQLDSHATLMRNLDAGIRALFENVMPDLRSRIAVMTFTEFGRRVERSDSRGTDHGTSSVMFLVGHHVRGGFASEAPSLGALDSRGDLAITTDVRAVFATVLDDWLDADHRELLGASHAALPLFEPNTGAGNMDPTIDTVAFQPVRPVRILDSRSGIGLGRVFRIGPGQTIDLPVAGQGPVPAAGAAAATMNVTVTGCDSPSYLTVWPAGEPRPNTSILNFVAGQTVPNLVISKLGAAGQVSIFNAFGTVDVIVDLLGWFPADNAYVPLVPARVLDTRAGTGAPAGKVGAGGVVPLVVRGRGGVPDQLDVDAVVMNVTVTEPDSVSYLTVWPDGDARPNASNLNMVAGQTVPNLVVAKVGGNGIVNVFNANGTTHLVADVLGWFPVGSGFHSLVPARILDTRTGVGAPAGKVRQTGLVELVVSGRGGVPSTATSVVMNVTATEADAVSYLTVWPAGQVRPDASSLNTVPGITVPNLVIAKVGIGGMVDLFNAFGSVHIIADVVGWFG
jgi:uncharacterized protein (DUF1501 family)